MSENADLPVIFLAFANEQQDQVRYLRGLAKEQTLIKEALEPAVDAGLCELVVESNASVKSILNTFQKKRYRDRIALFHYGGHADGYQLLLESLEGENVVAHGEGLVSFFSKQKGLRLIFLNGCSTQQQAMDLIKAGIPAVVGTSSVINDDIATGLAIRFYSSIGQGNSIDRAWKESEDEIRMTTGTANTRSLYLQALETVPDRFPWEIYFREGAEIVKKWNLPDAGSNPLFGLPDIPESYGLPDEPFLFLRRYERAQARLFFGRSYYIHALYKQATDPNGPSVILLHGQSGVGKSSLLDAGLLPRLEGQYEVVYIRRNQERGLLGTFQEALGVSQKHLNLRQLKMIARDFDPVTRRQFDTFIEKLRGEEASAGPDPVAFTDEELDQFLQMGSLFHVWQEIETKTGKPLVVILDQVEEMYTRPLSADQADADSPFVPEKGERRNEFRPFLLAIQSMFDQQKNPLKGKLILSYRKEYHPEIEEQFRQFQIHRSTIFLEQLSEKDIIEVFYAFASRPALRKKYNIQIEEGLAQSIARDLTRDPDSPVAPVFQIILSKLWQLSREEDTENPVFSFARYRKLQVEGIEMRDFYRQQMQRLRMLAGKVGQLDSVDSGLALDLLRFHVTELGTAGSHRMERVRERYARQEVQIQTLIRECASLSLLNHVDADTRTMLAHDTLAPVIEQEFKASDKPVQRAVRILAAKMEDRNALEQKAGEEGSTIDLSQVFLDETDLGIVESAQGAMPELSPAEEEMLEISRQKRAERKAKDRRNRTILAALLALLVAGSVIFAIFQNRSAAKIRAANVDRSSRSIARAEQEIQHLNYGEALALLKESIAFGFIPEGARQHLAELAYVYLEAGILDNARVALQNGLLTISGNEQSVMSGHLAQAERAWVSKDTAAARALWRQALEALLPEGQGQQLAETYYPEMVKVEGGYYMMGTDEPVSEEKEWAIPAHPVALENFEIGKYETTVAQYNLFCLATGRNMPEPTSSNWIARHPIVAVSWHSAVAYCDWLSQRTGIAYRLPTEAEWEYAARGGTKEEPFQYAGGDDLDSVAWHNENTNFTRPVGTKNPNGLGIYDMSGNVQEWCLDWFGPYPGDGDLADNPTGPQTGSRRVTRGGSWEAIPRVHRVTFRRDYDPDDDELVVVGFRCRRAGTE